MKTKRMMNCNGLVWYLLFTNTKLNSRIKKAVSKLNNGYQLTPYCEIDGFVLKKQVMSVAFKKDSPKGIKATSSCNQLLFESQNDQIKLLIEPGSNPTIETTKTMEVGELRNFLHKFCDYVLKS